MKLRIVSLPLALGTALISAACQGQSAPRAAPAASDAKIYMATKKIAHERAMPDLETIASPGIDGVFVRIAWDEIQTAPDRYDWSLLDPITKRALASGKLISIGVIAGQRVPRWLAKEGVPFITVMTGRRAKCEVKDIAAVWDPAYVRAYLRMMEGLKQHLVATGAFPSVRIVKISAIASHTLELRLPKNNQCSSTVDQKFSDAGYRPARLVAAWRDVASGMDRLFPGRLLVQPIMRKQGFPAVNDAGKTIGRLNDHTGDSIVSTCIQLLKARCGIQWNALNYDGPMADRVTDAHKRGATIGWQTNLFEGNNVGVGCQINRRAETIPCNEESYTKLLRRGIDLGGSFIEVWEADVKRFPKSFAAAKRDRT